MMHKACTGDGLKLSPVCADMLGNVTGESYAQAPYEIIRHPDAR
jgi:hypothetical protein